MKTFYNDNEKYVVEWMRNLVTAGHISQGDVSGEPIQNLEGWQLATYDRVHCFAGIAGWDLALRLAGWPENIVTWSGSAPCQPFSVAGKRKGVDDERHLWPVFAELIKQCKPAVIFGEQVASKDGKVWLAGVQADLEALGYLFAAADLCAASVGAPHIRQRLYWVAYSEHAIGRPELQEDGNAYRGNGLGGGCGISGLEQPQGEQVGVPGQPREPRSADQRASGPADVGFWRDSDAIFCADQKWRRVESPSFEMVDGLPASLGQLRPEQVSAVEKEIKYYGNAEKSRPGETMRDVWSALAADTLQGWPIGRPNGVFEAPFLLSFLLQLSNQGWGFSESVLRSSAETKEEILRSVWWKLPASCSSRKRGLEEQRSDESSNSLCMVSSILARHAQAAWGEAFNIHAASFHPLATGVNARVGKLRAYGNAICPPLAAEFISAFMEAVGIEPIR